MCYRTECPTCHKATYGGCGRHIEQALAGVPKEERCVCREKQQQGGNAPAASNNPASSNSGGGFFGKFF